MSVSTTRQHQTGDFPLPPELLDQIFIQLFTSSQFFPDTSHEYRAWFATLALICRRWTIPIQRQMLCSVSLSLRRLEATIRLLETMRTSPHLQVFLQWLLLGGKYGGAIMETNKFEHSILQLVSEAPNLVGIIASGSFQRTTSFWNTIVTKSPPGLRCLSLCDTDFEGFPYNTSTLRLKELAFIPRPSIPIEGYIGVFGASSETLHTLYASQPPYQPTEDLLKFIDLFVNLRVLKLNLIWAPTKAGEGVRLTNLQQVRDLEVQVYRAPLELAAFIACLPEMSKLRRLSCSLVNVMNTPSRLAVADLRAPFKLTHLQLDNTTSRLQNSEISPDLWGRLFSQSRDTLRSLEIRPTRFVSLSGLQRSLESIRSPSLVKLVIDLNFAGDGFKGFKIPNDILKRLVILSVGWQWHPDDFIKLPLIAPSLFVDHERLGQNLRVLSLHNVSIDLKDDVPIMAISTRSDPDSYLPTVADGSLRLEVLSISSCKFSPAGCRLVRSWCQWLRMLTFDISQTSITQGSALLSIAIEAEETLRQLVIDAVDFRQISNTVTGMKNLGVLKCSILREPAGLYEDAHVINERPLPASLERLSIRIFSELHVESRNYFIPWLDKYLHRTRLPKLSVLGVALADSDYADLASRDLYDDEMLGNDLGISQWEALLSLRRLCKERGIVWTRATKENFESPLAPSREGFELFWRDGDEYARKMEYI